MMFLGLSEVRWPDSGEFITNEGFSLIYSGKKIGEPKSNGVGILMTKETRKALKGWEPISDRIIVARFRTNARHLTCLQCYAPTEPSDLADKETFYSQLQNAFSSIPKGDITIVMGDVNAKVGSDNANYEKIMGKHGLGRRNENGDLFVDFCATNNLSIGGTLFPHREIHKITWVSPDQQTKNQVDHITICQKWRSSLLDVRNRRGADVGSDHHLLVGEIRTKLTSVKNRSKKSTNKKFNVHKLNHETIRDEYVQTLETNLPDIRPTNNLNDKWLHIKQLFIETAENVIGYKTVKKKPWISDQTLELIIKRKSAKAKLNESRTRNAKTENARAYNLLIKEVHRSARQDKRQWAQNLATEAQQAAEANNLRRLHQITKQLANQNFRSGRPIKNKHGNILTTTEDQLNRWHEFYEDLLRANDEEVPENPMTLRPKQMQLRSRIDSTPPTIEEIITAIGRLNLNKAAGPDGIPAELFKADPSTAATIILPVLEEIWITELLPCDWNHGNIINLPKKGDLLDCTNWRGISLLNTAHKVLAQIIYQRIYSTINSQLRNEQAGFRAKKSCVDHINTLRIITEQSNEFRSPLYLLFIDFEKAFDKLWHAAIWQTLTHFGLPDKIKALIKLLYLSPTCCVLHNGHLSNSIAIQKGVRQGCVLSPLLFNMVLDAILDSALQNFKGITWGMTKKLCDLDYADDICLISHSHSDVQNMLISLNAAASRAGLKINIKKTKCMKLNNTCNLPIILNNTVIEEVNEFCYLGSIITTNSDSDSDIDSRIAKARQAFGMLSGIWRSSIISQKTKIQLFNTNVKSVLLYGCESWAYTRTRINRIQVFVNKCLRSIFRIFWPNTISNADLWNKADQQPIENQIIKRKWGWIGHTLRRPNDDIARTALEWNPQGSRRRGRPNISWRRAVLKEAESTGLSWSQLKQTATNRSRWRTIVDALCSL